MGPCLLAVFTHQLFCVKVGLTEQKAELTDMADEERLKTIDLVNGNSLEEDVLWALNYLLNLHD